LLAPHGETRTQGVDSLRSDSRFAFSVSPMSIPVAVVDIVDDDSNGLHALARLLSSHGYRVCLFNSAEQYLNLNEGNAVCVVIDIHLGGMSGLDLGRVISSSPRPTPMVFMTGSPDLTLREQAAAMGCVAFLEKPVSSERLLAAIRRCSGCGA
jgi:FixJ family two-component response regulator